MINFLHNNYRLKTKLLILKTNINTSKKVRTLEDYFNTKSSILKWSIDLEDIDNVLKIRANKNLSENDIINQIKTLGFDCKDLDS